MGETTAVVLLFDDAELGGHLRDALSEGGARIVHEGALGDLSRDLLQRVGADVVVINLDDSSSDEAFDRLDEAIDGDRPRVVFNEAQSSRSLDGWDRARWARHLAAKVLAREDIDPPRPVVDDVLAGDDAQLSSGGMTDGDSPGDTDRDAAVETHEAAVAAESESLEAELEALLSGAPLPGGDATDVATVLEAPADGDNGCPPDDDLGFDIDLDIDALAGEPLYDGDFLDATAQAQPPAPEPAPAAATAAEDVSLSLAGLSLLEAGEVVDAAGPAGRAGAPDAPALPTIPDSWSLVDDDAPAVATGETGPSAPVAAHPDPGSFGIEKLSAAEYLAPEAEAPDTTEEAFLSLELVSLEDAIAPAPYQPAEMVLGELGGALTRIVMTGATATSRASVAEFFGQLPADLRVTIVHTEHLAGRPAEDVVAQLGDACALPVRLAADGDVARSGEVLVVPPECQLRVLREGKLELRSAQDMPASSPSIDGSFTAAASVFGSDALAILFAGQANDAVAGCQAVHDRGGRIWVEDAPGEHFADMVSGVLAERLADFSGTPAALAARLIEEYR